MSLSEIFKAMRDSFCIIVVGAMISMTIFCSIFDPGFQFGLEVFGQLFSAGVAGVSAFLVFYSRRVPGKREMLIRKILHVIVLMVLLLLCAAKFKWVEFDSMRQILLYMSCVLGVYGVVQYVSYQKNKKEAARLNERLKIWQEKK